VLVTGPLAVAVEVLVLAAFSIRNLMQSVKLDAGFDLQRTVWAQMRLVPESYPNPVQVRAMVASTLDQVRGLPGVESATVATFVPLNDHFVSRSSAVYTDGSMQGTRIEHWWNAVGPDYFRTMGIDLTAGREFSAADREDGQRVVIINEAFARKAFSGANPVGRRVRLGRQERVDRTVIGVVRNSKYSSLGEVNRGPLRSVFSDRRNPAGAAVPHQSKRLARIAGETAERRVDGCRPRGFGGSETDEPGDGFCFALQQDRSNAARHHRTARTGAGVGGAIRCAGLLDQPPHA